MENIKELLKKYKNYLLIAAFFIVIALIFLGGGSKSPKKVIDSKEQRSAEQYLKESEKRLGALLSEMDGVGKVQVYLTLENSGEKIYAKESKNNQSYRSDITDKSGDKMLENAADNEEKIIILRNSGGDESPVLLKNIEPKIRGAVIICEGGDFPAVRERVIAACCAALGTPSSKICVTK